MKIIDLSRDRNNNFNLIRILAALAVLITHSYALSIGTGDAEPLRKHLDITLGMIAVDIFFITSGFLITSSLMNSQSILYFVCARFLRIFPALWIMLIFTILIIGPYFSTRSLSAYILDYNTSYYLAKCSTLFWGARYELPGVFSNNPYKYAINGSLWTLPWEVRMYATLVITWIGVGVLAASRFRVFRILIISYSLASAVCLICVDLRLITITHINELSLFFMFFTGAAIYLMRHRISLSTPAFYFILIILLISTINKSVFHITYHLSMPYMVLYLAYIPSGLIRCSNLIGDYSYGMYIYAFPVQQSIAALIPGISVAGMLVSSAAPTILLAVISWHIVEKRALGLKETLPEQIRKLLVLFFSPLSAEKG